MIYSLLLKNKTVAAGELELEHVPAFLKSVAAGHYGDPKDIAVIFTEITI